MRKDKEPIAPTKGIIDEGPSRRVHEEEALLPMYVADNGSTIRKIDRRPDGTVGRVEEKRESIIARVRSSITRCVGNLLRTTSPPDEAVSPDEWPTSE